MIIWQGYGFVVAVIVLVVMALTEGVVESATGDDKYFQRNHWPAAVGAILSAGIIWPLGRKLNRQAQSRELIDPSTGEIVVQNSGEHTLFFIPMEYWAYMLLAFGAFRIFDNYVVKLFG